MTATEVNREWCRRERVFAEAVHEAGLVLVSSMVEALEGLLEDE